MPAYTWIIALKYVCFLLNHTHAAGIKGITITKDTGSTANISPLLYLNYCKPFY